MGGGDRVSNQQAYYREGNTFSRIHRKLEGWRCCTDFDYIEYNDGVCQDSGDQVYAEYDLSPMIKAVFEYKSRSTPAVIDNIRNMRQGTSMWFQSKLCEQLRARFFIVLADNDKMPLLFLEVKNGIAYRVGELVSDEPTAVKRFWSDVLKL